MKKVFNNSMFMFVLGILVTVCFGIGVYAINASEIDYRDTKVDQALDYLYTEANSPIIDKVDFSYDKNYYMGNRTAGITKTVSVNAGNYIVSVVNSHAWAVDSSYNFNGNIDSNASSWINATNGNCELINGYYVEPTATVKTDATKYVSQYTYSNLYKCHFNQSGTISFTTNDGTYNDCTQGIIIQTIKID